MGSASDTAGLAPATPVYTGSFREHGVHAHEFCFDEGDVVEREVLDVASSRAPEDDGKVRWIDITGLAQVDVIQAVCREHAVHPLAIEDILNTDTRAKAEAFGPMLLVIAPQVRLVMRGGVPELSFEHTSLVTIGRTVLSFQEVDGDAWDGVRRRLRTENTRVRTNGADFLAYALLDAVIDQYSVVVETLSRQAEAMEAHLLDDPDSVSIREIYILRRELMELRRKAWPYRDALNTWLRSPSLDAEVRPFLRDLQDHITQVVEAIDLQRDLMLGMIELHHSGVSNKMNATMQVLTVISTLFIPLTFLTGLYGMNFDHMPELHTEYGYYILITVMLMMFAGGLLLFKRKGLL